MPWYSRLGVFERVLVIWVIVICADRRVHGVNGKWWTFCGRNIQAAAAGILGKANQTLDMRSRRQRLWEKRALSLSWYTT